MEQRLNEQSTAYDAIISRIADGQLKPGMWLREAALSEEIGTSRTPVREALRALAADGLVELVKNRGARVRNWTNEQVSETYNLRALLEGYAASLACANATEEHIRELRRIQDDLEAALEARRPEYLDEVAIFNAEFHRRIANMANSPLLANFIETIASVSLVRRAFRGYSNDDLSRTVSSHRDILLGIETSAPDLAQTAMQAHILAAKRPAMNVLHKNDNLPESAKAVRGD